MTSLDMRGFHISVLRLRDPSWLVLLDTPTSAPAWPSPCLADTHSEDQVKFPDLSLTFSHEKVVR